MPQVISLKFSELTMPHSYDPSGIEDLHAGDFVVAEREGTEDIGFVAAIEWISQQQLKLRQQPMGRLVRRATEPEQETFVERRLLEKRALSICKEMARKLNLPIKVTSARYDAADARLIFTFTSDTRVDFRALVRELNLILKTRIELLQIGVRDEAKTVDGLGVCGLRLCCSSWLPEFRPINLRMAKDQDINLPPQKLSGPCGRLLCCLSYEVDQYREMSKSLLPKGATITVDSRTGVIIDRNVLMQRYTVQFPEGNVATVGIDGIEQVQVPDQMKRMARVMGGGQRPKPTPTPEAKPVEAAAPEPAAPESPEGEKSRRRKRRRGPHSHKAEGAEAARAEQAAPPDAPRSSEPAAAEGEGSPRKRRRRRGGRRHRGEHSGGDSGPAAPTSE